MRSIYGYSAALLAAAQMININPLADLRIMPTADFTAPKRRRTGKTYPHSSKRQQERFARQLAAGQVKFTA